MKQIFPKEIIKNTIEVHQFKHRNRSKIIYGCITLAVLGLLIALPFIKVTIYTTSQGYIKPDKERISIQTSINGEIVFHQFRNNKNVVKGDTLLVLKNSAIQQKIASIHFEILETQKFIADIHTLINNKKPLQHLQSLKFKDEFSAYQQKLYDLKTRFRKLKQDYTRNQKLYNRGVIAKVTLQDLKLEYDVAFNAINQFKKQQKSTWQNTLVTTKNNLQALLNTKSQLEENYAATFLKAPNSGTLLDVKGVEKGNFIMAGVPLAEISPDSNLVVECYINPTDIGLLKIGDTARFQVTAFNYNQWGLATGKIINIGNDIQFINNSPVFKIQCSLEKKYLQLKNGFKGTLKKGMSVNARFELTERTLFDLLYDKTDDWLNPNNQSLASSN